VPDQMLLPIAIIAIVIIFAVVAWFALQRRRSGRLREQFGPEYERTVEAAPDRRRAEAELRARQERVEALEIRPLDADTREKFVARWRVVQAMFVDDPASAVHEADTLIGEVMRARGYPVGDFEQRAADVSVNHPQLVDHYRTAHAIAERARPGERDTEQLRQAFVHYRALFADLLEIPETSAAYPQESGPTASPAARAESPAAPGGTPESTRGTKVEPAPPPASEKLTGETSDESVNPARRA
jgi:hypothetical protein